MLSLGAEYKLDMKFDIRIWLSVVRPHELFALTRRNISECLNSFVTVG